MDEIVDTIEDELKMFPGVTSIESTYRRDIIDVKTDRGADIPKKIYHEGIRYTLVQRRHVIGPDRLPER